MEEHVIEKIPILQEEFFINSVLIRSAASHTLTAPRVDVLNIRLILIVPQFRHCYIPAPVEEFLCDLVEGLATFNIGLRTVELFVQGTRTHSCGRM